MYLVNIYVFILLVPGALYIYKAFFNPKFQEINYYRNKNLEIGFGKINTINL